MRIKIHTIFGSKWEESRPKHEKKSKGVKSKYFIDVLEALNSGFEKKINKPQRGGVRKLGIHLT